jgi:dihydrofolate reductase
MLLRDIAGVKSLKQEDGPNLVTQGSTELVHALLANDLVDAMSIFTLPVVLGGSKSCSPTAQRRIRSSLPGPASLQMA